jgi:sulfoacetaldehyde acetyltransferase
MSFGNCGYAYPMVAVVWNNRQWGAEKKNQIDFYDDRYVGTNLTNPDFAAVARSMGAEGIGVQREADLQGAVTEAFGSDKPVVLDVAIDSSELGEPFRRDALKLPTRHLDKYAHLNG